MLRVVGRLEPAPPLGLPERRRHRVRDPVGVHDHLAVDVPGGPPRGLDERRRRPQVPFLVGVEDRHQRHLRDVEALAEEVDADEPVELAEPEVADQLDPVERVDVGVEVPHAEPHLLVVLGEVLRHPLGEAGDEDALFPRRPTPDLLEQVVDLLRGGPYRELRVREARRSDDLLCHRVARQAELVRGGRRRHVHDLAGEHRELLEGERAVVEGRGQPEAVLDQRLLPRPVAVVHAADLRHRHVALVDDDQRVLGQIVHQRRRRLPRPPAGEVPRVVLDAVTEAELAQHLHVEERALLEPLRFQQPVPGAEEGQALRELLGDGGERVLELLGRGHVVARRVDVRLGLPAEHGSPQRVDLADRLHGVAEQLDAQRLALLVGREHLHDVAADPEGPAVEVVVVPLVLDGHELAHDLVPVDLLSLGERQVHALVGLGRADAVDAGDGRHDDHVPALHERSRRGVTHPVDLVVDERILFDVGVALGDVRLGLIVVVVRDEVLGGVVREERLELTEELGRKRLVRRDDEGRPLDVRDHVGHREGLSRPGHAEQHSVATAVLDEASEPLDRLRLVTARLIFCLKSEGCRLCLPSGAVCGSAPAGRRPGGASPRPSGRRGNRDEVLSPGVEKGPRVGVS